MMNTIRALLLRARNRLRVLRARLRTWWLRHRDRIAEDSGHAETLVTATVAVAEVIGATCRVRNVASTVVAAYVAIIRALAPSSITDTGGWV